VAKELERPAADEEGDADPDQVVPEDAREQDWDREHDDWDSKGVGEPVERVLMALGVFGDPTVPTASAKHAKDSTLRSRVPAMLMLLPWVARRRDVRRAVLPRARA